MKHTVIGVTPADFTLWVRDANLFVPHRSSEGRVVARLKPGVSIEQAEAEIAAIQLAAVPESRNTARAEKYVISFSEAFRNHDGTTTLLLLQATVGLVLLITCANVANLSLVRSSARRKEFAIRMALGSGRWQLFRQLIAESALLAAMGGALGLLLAAWSLDFLHSQLPANVSRYLRGADPLSIDGLVLAFTAGVSLLTVLLFGVFPAVGALRFDVMPALKDTGKGATPHRHRVGQALVITEVALALMLLIGAGLTLKSLIGLHNTYLGFSPDHVLRGVVELPFTSTEQRVAAMAEIVRRCQALPGVETVGVLAPQFFPFGGPRVRGALFAIEGRPEAEGRAEVYVANPDYFRSVRIPLLRGRMFTEADTAASSPVALISEIVARRFWGYEDPIGRSIRLQADRPESPWVTVIGVVGDVRNPVGLDVQPTAYRPHAQTPTNGSILLIRTAGEPLALAEAARNQIRSVDPNAPDFRAANLETAVRDYINPQRFMTSVLGLFAGLGLLLAAVGVYGVMRYWVSSRIPEMGMRIALGAERRHVLSLVVGKAAQAALIGVAIGIAGAFVFRRVIASQLYGVSPVDLSVFAAVSALMAAVAVGAAFLPARWATKVDPVVALRHE